MESNMAAWEPEVDTTRILGKNAISDAYTTFSRVAELMDRRSIQVLLTYFTTTANWCLKLDESSCSPFQNMFQVYIALTNIYADFLLFKNFVESFWNHSWRI
jgi:hypothetical protein